MVNEYDFGDYSHLIYDYSYVGTNCGLDETMTGGCVLLIAVIWYCLGFGLVSLCICTKSVLETVTNILETILLTIPIPARPKRWGSTCCNLKWWTRILETVRNGSENAETASKPANLQDKLNIVPRSGPARGPHDAAREKQIVSEVIKMISKSSFQEFRMKDKLSCIETLLWPVPSGG